ncbi:helix-turn-helix domain-containing protein [Pseudomonas lopnurensis]|uniref:helix-turn-helix domain-containing protein n=1 Tax=Pseudomonas lopnurensis TaxID=1477517 RepID=UPI001F3253FC|nr:helix-turn-helix transcriptional regulator [Pseudomonas lopnurensis]
MVIAVRRKAKGLTQAQVAEIMGVEKETISRMENGVISPTLPRLQQIADILECSPSDLFRTGPTNAADHAQSIGEMIQDLPENERMLVVSFVSEVVKVFKARGTPCGKEEDAAR